MDPLIQQEPRKLLGHLSEDELAELTRLLEVARKPCVDAQNGVSCDGAVSCDGTSASA
jgi:hypothetical protein